ncbi:MAG: hypothetical protein EOO77_10580 [Oxalobacteraceae bacterium]|jgi:hypothetical protein|uniref:hypothetical protein n=1 Tax=Sphingomonas sp. Leaf208 TaxID=1735679 RepID=UPI0006F2221F|nr:hypothetical protein [Sphingomonas sp. Leaf208]KQM53090.1 hypothetical protein ASE69_04730 [Sphingomonas sp. Leaf208]RYF19066.1 MAG: hypothetical protein EOO77_10580 [Oxalobacteraceae bacterium]
MVTVRFSNETDQAIELMVEPWGAVESIPAGAGFAIHYSPQVDREDTSYAEYHAGMIRFWVEGSDYEVDVDGQPVPT